MTKMKYYPEIKDKALNKEMKSFLAEEPSVAYATKPKTFDELLEDKFLLIQTIAAGIPYSFFEKIQRRSPFTVSEWAELLGVSYKSMQRYQATNSKFKPVHSEKILEYSEVFEIGMKFFQDKDQFKNWLQRETIAFGGMRPIDVMQSSYGKELVVERLGNYEHGIFI